MPYSVAEVEPAIGGLPVICLRREQRGTAPQIVEAQLLPGRGMNVCQLRAALPGKGVVPLIASPSLEEAARKMDGGPEDAWGNQSYTLGGALLIPYANRIGGELSADGRTVKVEMLGRDVDLPANWNGTAMHGLILNRAFIPRRTWADSDGAHAEAELDAGNFGGHWLSETHLTVDAALSGAGFSLTVTARNTGAEPTLMSIGWHPYFAIPSGERAQARLHVPARSRALVNNYEDMAPTGEVESVEGTPFDFSQPGGAALGTQALDECFLHLESAAVELTDPAFGYGLRVTAHAPEVRALQIYSPADSRFVAIEPQLNILDPFSQMWPEGTANGMVVLPPAVSVSYRVHAGLFEPF